MAHSFFFRHDFGFGTILVRFWYDFRTNAEKNRTIGKKIVPKSYHGPKIVPKSYHGIENRTKLIRPTKIPLVQNYSTPKIWQSELVHNFRYKNPFLMIFAPFESPESQLSNGAKIIKNG